MITTVTLNAAIDKTYYVPSFAMGQVNRVQRMYSEPGGKGINVSKVLHRLGIDVIATGFIGGYNGEYIEASLNKRGIEHYFVSVKGESRICLNIVDETSLIGTEVLETGPVIGSDDWERLQERIDSLAAKSEFVIFSGSLPRGLSTDAYGSLIRIAHRHKANPVVDTSGLPLEMSLSEKPFMVKPNRDELAALMGMDSISEHDIFEVMREWRAKGITLVVVSLGSKGAIVSYQDAIFKVIPPRVNAVNPVGSGDALVAGITAGLVSDLNIEETLALATAAAAANATAVQAGNVTRDEVNRLRLKVKVNRLEQYLD